MNWQASNAQTAPWEGVRLYVGADAYNLQGRRFRLTGPRMFSAAVRVNRNFTPEDAPLVEGLLDSGAFTDVRKGRTTPQAALERQFAWEAKASQMWGCPWQAAGFVSYDRLIDEKEVNGVRKKERWTVAEAKLAVRQTVQAARHLDSCRRQVEPRKLVFGVQGVDHRQYASCTSEVLAYAKPHDVIGLGGWCILGLQRTWLPTFWASMHAAIPLIARAGIKHVHIFGVIWKPPLAGLLWLCDQFDVAVSTDSSAPALNVTRKCGARAGLLADTWEENIALTKKALAGLRDNEYYREPPRSFPLRQELLFR